NNNNNNINNNATTASARVNSNCNCITQGLCQSVPSWTSAPSIDIRIVNQGTQGGCPSGQFLCCGTSGNYLTSSCGIQKITNSPAQSQGIAKYGQYPWQVALLKLNNEYIGSGVLISPTHILTAAHKVVTYPNTQFKVRLGDWNGIENNEPYPYQEYNPASVKIHENFNSQSLYNDIAIIKISGIVPLDTSPHINTACLPTSMPAAGTRCWVTGWGKNAFGPTGSYQNILRQVEVPIVDQSTCENKLRNTRLGQAFILDKVSFMCAGGEIGKDACTGDGGAPLVCQSSTQQWSVVGLVSWGIGCAQDVPGVYVNVVNYLPWIYQNMN
ncbi:phenoloxidase-activating factor 2-like, partial [Microplitis mediator]|uniref:phenoloxidase-activating factor 2-like n=1 Tax=Microplitis mediator TaxID=375433 RepID=UPI0025531020